MSELTPEEISAYLDDQQQKYQHHQNLVYKEYYRTLMRQQIKMNLELGNHHKVPHAIVELWKANQSIKEQYEQQTSKNHIGFFTINPKPGNTEETLVLLEKCLQKFLTKKWVQGTVYYTYEQRSEKIEDVGKGIHMHILFLRNNRRPYNVKIETYSTFKKCYGKGKKQKQTMESDYKFYPYEYWQDKIAYMDGSQKWDEDKHEKQKIDKIFHEKYKLKKIYKVEVPKTT